MVAGCEKLLREEKWQPDTFFYTFRGGRNAHGQLAEVFTGYDAVQSDHPYWSDGQPETMLIDEVETLWSAIAERDDWEPLNRKIEALRRMGEAHGNAPIPGGLLSGRD